MPETIHINDLTKALTERSGQLKALNVGTLDKDAGFFPNPGVIGYILRDPAFGKLDPAMVNSAAAGMAEGFGKPVTILREKDLLIGFIPRQNLTF